MANKLLRFPLYVVMFIIFAISTVKLGALENYYANLAISLIGLGIMFLTWYLCEIWNLTPKAKKVEP